MSTLSLPRKEAWRKFHNHRRARNRRIRIVLAVVGIIAALGVLVYTVERTHAETSTEPTAPDEPRFELRLAQVMRGTTVTLVSGTGEVTPVPQGE